MTERVVKVCPSFEASSAARLVQAATKFGSHVSLVLDEKTANAKSIMGIISLDLRGGNSIKIIADGTDENGVIPEIEKILSGS